MVEAAVGVGGQHAGHRVGQEGAVDDLDAAADRVVDQAEQRQHGEHEGGPDQAGRQPVLGLPAPLDGDREDVLRGDEQQHGDQAPLQLAGEAEARADPGGDRHRADRGGRGGPVRQPAAGDVQRVGHGRGLAQDVGHQAFAPEYSLRRWMMIRAAPLTIRVITKSTRPEAISALTPNGEASAKELAMFAASVPPP